MKSSLFKAVLSLTLVVAMLMTVPYVNAITVGENDATSAVSSTYGEKSAVNSDADVSSEGIVIDASLPQDTLEFTDDASVTGRVEADYTIDENGIAWPTATGAHDITLFETPEGKVAYTYELSGYTPDATATYPNALGVVFAKDAGGVYVYSLSAYNSNATLTTTLRNVYYVPYNSDGSFASASTNIAYLSESYNGGTTGNGSVGGTVIQAYEVLDSSYTGEVNELAQNKGYVSTAITAASTGKMNSFCLHETGSNVQNKAGYTLDKFTYKYYLKASGDVVYIYVDMICADPEDTSVIHTWRTLTDCFSLENFKARESDWKSLYGAKKLDTAYYNAGDHSDFEIAFGIAVSPKTGNGEYKSVVTDVNAVYASPYTIKNGIVEEDGGSRIYYRNFYLTGLQNYNGDYYYCDDETGYIKTSGTYELDGVVFTITSSGKFELDVSQFDTESELTFYNVTTDAQADLETLPTLGTTYGEDKNFESYLLNTKGEEISDTDPVTKSLYIEGTSTYMQIIDTESHTASATYSMKGASTTGNLGIVIAEDENGYYTYKITPTESTSSNIFFNRSIEYHKYADETKTTLGSDTEHIFDIASILGSDDLLYANATRVGAKRNSNASEIYSTVKGGIFETGTTKAVSADYPVTDFTVHYYMTVDSDNTISVYAVLSCGDAKWTTYAEDFTTDNFAFATDESWLKYSTTASTAYRKYVAVSHDDVSPLFGIYKGIKLNDKGKLQTVEVEIESIDYNFNTTANHVWKTTTVAPTCCTDGYIIYKCDCGAEDTKPGKEAYGHKYDADNLTIVQEADSTTNSIKNGYCTECGIHCYYIEADYLGEVKAEYILGTDNTWKSVNQ